MHLYCSISSVSLVLLQKLPWRERKHLLRRDRKRGEVELRHARPSGAHPAVPRSEEETPTISSRKRPRREGTEDALHVESELTKEPMYKVCPSALLAVVLVVLQCTTHHCLLDCSQ